MMLILRRSNIFECQTRSLIWLKTNNKDSRGATVEEEAVVLRGVTMVEEEIEVVEAEVLVGVVVEVEDSDAMSTTKAGENC
jgi:hypothetical protein